MLEETGVAILPGEEFGRPPEELTARLAYVDFDGSRALAAAALTPADQPLSFEFVRTYCGGVVEASQRMGEWLRSEG
ncbi:MAG: hypothetical protein R2724_24370 [Bryobacterales bacterium]